MMPNRGLLRYHRSEHPAGPAVAVPDRRGNDLDNDQENSHFLIRLPMGAWFTWLAIGLSQTLITWLTYGIGMPRAIMAAIFPRGASILLLGPLRRRYRAERRESDLRARAAGGICGAGDLCLPVAPMIARQIDAARWPSQEAVNSLAPRFSGLAERLANAVATSRQAAERMNSHAESTISHVLSASKNELTALIDSLASAERRRAAMLQEIQGLIGCTAELRNIIQEVTIIAHSPVPWHLTPSLSLLAAGAATLRCYRSLGVTPNS